jgi:membrane associated rhomboid family serine protease
MILKLIRNYKQTIILVLLNIIIFCISNQVDLNYFYYFSAWKLDSGLFSPHQLLTYQFLHANVDHLYFNMCFLIYFVTSIEKNYKYPILLYNFLIFGVFAGITHLLLSPSQFPLIGASGSVMGISVLAALLSRSWFIKFFVFAFVLSDIFCIILPSADNIAYWAHIGGSLSALLTYLLNNQVKK